MTRFDPYGDLPRALRIALVALLLVAAVATAGAFAADPEATAPSPAAYDDVVELGLSSETDALMAGSARVPRTQVFYSQLQYVVGYNGVESFAATLDDGRTERQFGYPIAAYVETFDGARPGTIETGLFAAESAGEWTPAAEATYVVGSDARSPAGETVVPFRERGAAEAFAADHGGRAVDWETVRSRSFDTDSAATVRAMAPERWAGADGRIAAAERRADRPVSVVVGEDAPTIEAAVAAAPANTTVVVPPGTYEETLTVNESVTIAGEDAQISGDGDGSVITVRAPDVALTGLAVDGSGGQTRDPEAAREGRADDGGVNGSDDGEVWDTNIQLGYGHGDAGIRAIGAPGLVVDDVTVEANASGLLLREGSHAVVRDLRVDGADSWQDGFMGIAGMGSRVTVTDSAFEGGRDGIYLHRADGSVVRNSTFTDNRYGTHLMYTGDALIADNAFRNELFGGITVMTRPSGNAIVGNDVRNSSAGVQASGTRTYVGYNTLVGNELGFSTSSRGSLYERNVAANNELGARATTVVPSSRIVANDFVGNADHATAGAGALRVWADGDRGNYWEGANVGVHEPGERAYRPTAPVDAALHREVAAVAVRESPAVALLDRLRGTVPGARSGSIIDPAPAAEPYSPDRIDAALDPDAGPVRADWRAELGDGSGESDEDAAMNAHDRNATSGGIGPRPQRSDRTTVPTVEGATASIRGVSDA
ncbi:NosD domain-containing protein [Halorubrum lacusprofundi]|uniref:Copper-binding protein n=1 Tax=Halorubrum lacusprofundi (strain ATCC 49239 / DSM 5036 / JCM 8891 / ACAM 34) TaxID=416348 RepID=B9LPL7_HALLT|nr:NosD domain-containing protein [Halorubrum lacusprofundi]ACM57305.1 copper-binding protein [Halorubrum lacusprofundi ATCC 49239]MCG1006087.1 right-handed parallel beta-helix repeat-containing protein [Halorubrum lacusprofundi]